MFSFSAIYSAKVGNDVTILERNDRCGKKLLITGNGRCNYWNEVQNSNCYYTSSYNNILDIINKEKNDEVLNFFESIGITPRIKNGYYYPLSNQASSVNNALITEAKLRGVKIETGVLVTDITKENDVFKVVTDKGVYESDKVILATGSKAAPKTGSDGFGYDILKTLGHTIIKPLPALVQLICADKIQKDWDGVRNDSLISLYINDEKIKEEEGEIMLTDYGLSGICIFNLSSMAARSIDNNGKVDILINFLPSLNLHTTKEAIEWFTHHNQKVSSRTISELLDGLLNYKLVNALLKKTSISRAAHWDELRQEEKENLIKSLISYKIEVVGTNSFDKAQVCSGGLSMQEIDINTMESKKVSDLYIVGELLDVDGECGGFNLGFAWISGYLAGRSISNND